MSLIDQLASNISDASMKIVFPEGEEIKIIQAAKLICEKNVASPILLGSTEKILSLAAQDGIDPSKFSIVDPVISPLLERYIGIYSKEKKFPEKATRKILQANLGFGAMMVKTGDADAMIAGISHATEQVIMISQLIIGMMPGISIPSSFMVFDIPGYQSEEGSLLVIADPAINPEPTPEELADIAISTATNVQEILGWEPRVAMLSFSTHGSASHPLADKVVRAVEIIHERAPLLSVDGELQLDAAIVPEVAKRKVKRESKVAGRANVLIFPDLNSANIGCKLIQRLAKAQAYGTILQGFALPVSDLSRGATVEDIFGVATILSVRGKAQ
ncbi:MAG: phosphate acyltransferase [Anaerolineaceae bacterium]